MHGHLCLCLCGQDYELVRMQDGHDEWEPNPVCFFVIKVQDICPGGAVKYEVDTGVRPALQQTGAFGESTDSKNEGSLGPGESMIFGIQ